MANEHGLRVISIELNNNLVKKRTIKVKVLNLFIVIKIVK